MTLNEKKLASTEKKLNKLYERLNKNNELLKKKIAKCIALDCNWTDEEWCNHRDTNDMTDSQYTAYFSMGVKQDEITDLQYSISCLEKTLKKQEQKVREDNEKNEAFQAEYNHLNNVEVNLNKAMKENEYKEWLAQFKQDCLKDGIIVEDACSSFIYGTTPSGKSFMISSNDGYTERSWHCYSVRINGNTIFTSGEFWRAYNTVKAN